MKNYPTWRYHSTENPRVVKSEVEENNLGDGWADTPAAFHTPEPFSEPKPEPVVVASVSAPVKLTPAAPRDLTVRAAKSEVKA